MTLIPNTAHRLDFPDSDPKAMFESMRKLSALDDSIPVFPGHNYGGYRTTVGREKTHGALGPRTFAEWERFYASR